jgi:hypothetical protein
MNNKLQEGRNNHAFIKQTFGGPASTQDDYADLGSSLSICKHVGRQGLKSNDYHAIQKTSTACCHVDVVCCMIAVGIQA